MDPIKDLVRLLDFHRPHWSTREKQVLLNFACGALTPVDSSNSFIIYNFIVFNHLLLT